MLRSNIQDNPPSDIQGANNMGAPWQSCLVRTGNFHGVHHNDETYPAQHVMEDMWTVVNTMLVSRARFLFFVRIDALRALHCGLRGIISAGRRARAVPPCRPACCGDSLTHSLTHSLMRALYCTAAVSLVLALAPMAGRTRHHRGTASCARRGT